MGAAVFRGFVLSFIYFLPAPAGALGKADGRPHVYGSSHGPERFPKAPLMGENINEVYWNPTLAL